MVHRADGVDFEALCTARHPERSPDAAIPGGWGTATSSPGELDWIPCQEFGEPDPEKLNHHLKSDLENGVHGIWLRLDRAARQGDDPLSSGSASMGGAALYRLADLAAAFDGAPVSWRSILLDAGASFLPAAAMLVGWMQSAGLETEKRALLLGADPLGTLARDGELPTSLDQLSRRHGNSRSAEPGKTGLQAELWQFPASPTGKLAQRSIRSWQFVCRQGPSICAGWRSVVSSRRPPPPS